MSMILQIRNDEFTELMPLVAQGLGLSVVQRWEWETALPYNVDWSTKSQAERIAAYEKGWNFTEDVWNAMPWGAEAGLWERRSSGTDRQIVWNPWQQYTRENLPAKPIWAAVFAALRKRRLAEELLGQRGESETKRVLALAKGRVANAPAAHSRADDPVHVGGGIEHMPALMHHTDQATFAGEVWPLVLMRDVAGEPVTIWTEDHARELLTPLAAARNRAESAGNILYKKVRGYEATIADENGGLDATATDEAKLAAREAALNSLNDIRDRADHHMAEALKEYDRQAASLPSDMPTLKNRLMHLVEAEGAAQIKRMRNVLSQQGFDLPPACDDSKDASTKVAALVIDAANAIRMATTATNAKAAFDAGVDKIKAVIPLNVPEWQHLNGTAISAPFPVRSRTFAIRAFQPSGVPGNIGVDVSVKARPGKLSVSGTPTLAALSGNPGGVLITLSTDEHGAIFTLKATNICGANKPLEITLEPNT